MWEIPHYSYVATDNVIYWLGIMKQLNAFEVYPVILSVYFMCND